MKNIGCVKELSEDRSNVQKELPFTDIIRSIFVDHRLVTVARTTENSFLLAVENPVSSGRGKQSSIHLTEASMLALMMTIVLYYTHKKIDVEKLMHTVHEKEFLEYEYLNAEEENE